MHGLHPRSPKLMILVHGLHQEGPITDVLEQDFQCFRKNLSRTTKESREKSLTQVY